MRAARAVVPLRTFLIASLLLLDSRVSGTLVAAAGSTEDQASIVRAATQLTAIEVGRSAPRVPGSGPRTFTGHPVSLDFQDLDLRAVLRTFAEISGLNIVIDPDVKGTVNVSLHEVPWDQALDIILRANQLDYTVEGTVVRIAPLEVLREESEARRKLADEEALSGELRTVTQTLSYAKAKELAPLLTKTALTKRSQIEVDERTNTLILTDLQVGLDKALKLVKELDTPQPQVSIEARIIETSKAFARELGIRLGISGEVSPAIGNTTPLSFPNQGTISGTAGRFSPFQDSARITLGALNGAFNLDAALSALENENKIRILSSPRVVTQDNVEAEIVQGQQIPYTTATVPTGAGNASFFVPIPTVQFKDVFLKLLVRPKITASGTIQMDVVVENSIPDRSRQPANVSDAESPPAISTQRAKTTVLVTDGGTTMLGGVISELESNTEDRTPGLHRVPFLGLLFKRHATRTEGRELVLFITPKIVKS
jgi:type IV pilus assembly protein PilQ